MKTNIMQNIKSFILVLALVLGVGYAYANFTSPLHTPPTCLAGEPGCDAPINVSGTAQAKNGPLTVGGTALPTASYKLNVPGLASFNGILTQALTLSATGAATGKVLTSSDANGNVTWGTAVTKIIAGTNMTISPASGTGNVTIIRGNAGTVSGGCGATGATGGVNSTPILSCWNGASHNGPYQTCPSGNPEPTGYFCNGTSCVASFICVQ